MNKTKDLIKVQISSLQDSLIKIDNAIANEKAKQFLESNAEVPIYANCLEGAKLKKSPNPLEVTFATFPKSTKVRLLDFKDGYFGISVDTLYGYMNEVWILIDGTVKEYYEAKLSEERRLKGLVFEKIEEEKKKQEQRYINLWGKANYEKVKRGEYWIGMTREMCILSLGYPEKINKSVGSWGVNEQWVFKDGKYLYFENDIIKSYQE
ncbi:MAG: hypothetical protein K9I26_06780 [Flavobacterium sp.]|nr:hypothetical protein [Flavobacterium sp.]